MQTHLQILNISTINDSNNQQSGRIEVTLVPDTISPALYTLIDNKRTASVVVQDDDLPVIAISSNRTAVEGDSIEFTISTDVGRSSDLMIGYQIQGDIAHYMSPSQPLVGTILLTAGGTGTTTTLTIATDQDNRDEPDGILVVDLLPDSAQLATYELSSTQNSARVLVQDDEVPVISISGGESITESEVAEFTIQSNSILESSVSVNYSVSDGINTFLSLTHASTGSVELDGSNSNALTTLSIPTIGDYVDELDGTITVSLLPDTNIPPLYED